MTLYGTAEGVATRRGLVASWGRWGWLALWCALWAGLNAAPVAVGAETLHTVRGWMPLLAGSLILAVGDPVRVLTLRDPLSLCTLYGMIGLGASLLCSPDPATACYWASAYLAVPMVLLWCRMQDDGARRLDTIVTVTWGLVAASGLILIGAAWMASGSVWLGDLYGITGRRPVFAGMPMARGTGIARYAGLIAVIALTRLLWSRSLRIRTVWIIVLVVCGVIMWRSLSAGANLAWLAAAGLLVALRGGWRWLMVIAIIATGLTIVCHDAVWQAVLRGKTLTGLLSGRSEIWGTAWQLWRASPLLGLGFHADRLLMEWPYRNHVSNGALHALLQAGALGAACYVAAWVLAWKRAARGMRALPRLTPDVRMRAAELIGVLGFLTVRSIFESTGAFFGVDWLVLAAVFAVLGGPSWSRTALTGEGAS